MFYTLEPEVAGHFGDNTIGDLTLQPPVVSELHYELDGWPEDDLLETISCFIVTDRLRAMIEELAWTGCEFGPVEVTTSELFDEFRELHRNQELPKFWWLRITGKAGVDDFGLSSSRGNPLVVTERVLSVMREQCKLNNCDITEFE